MAYDLKASVYAAEFRRVEQKERQRDRSVYYLARFETPDTGEQFTVTVNDSAYFNAILNCIKGEHYDLYLRFLANPDYSQIYLAGAPSPSPAYGGDA